MIIFIYHVRYVAVMKCKLYYKFSHCMFAPLIPIDCGQIPCSRLNSDSLTAPRPSTLLSVFTTFFFYQKQFPSDICSMLPERKNLKVFVRNQRCSRFNFCSINSFVLFAAGQVIRNILVQHRISLLHGFLLNHLKIPEILCILVEQFQCNICTCPYFGSRFIAV